jgi:O-antigen ligase
MATDTLIRTHRLKLIRPPRVSPTAGLLVFIFWFYNELHMVVPLLVSSDLSKVTLMAAVFSFLLLLAMVVCALKSPLLPWPRNNTIFWALIFLAWSGASILWTYADNRGSALGYWGELFILTSSVMLMMRFGDREQVATRAFDGIFWGMLLVVLIVLFTGTTSGGRLGDPDLLHPNAIGRESAVALLLGFYSFRHSKTKGRKIALALGSIVLFVALIGTVSKTSVAGFFAAMIVYAMLSQPAATRFRIAAVILLAALTAMPFTAGKLEEYSQSNRGQAVETVSGRTPLWSDTWQMIQERPLIGYGYLSFRDYGPQIFNVRVVHAHNEVLNIWFTLGILGLGITCMLYGSFARNAWKARRSPHSMKQANLALAILVLCLVRSLTEADTRSLVFQLPLMVFLASWISSARRSLPASVLTEKCVPWTGPLVKKDEASSAH